MSSDIVGSHFTEPVQTLIAAGQLMPSACDGKSLIKWLPMSRDLAPSIEMKMSLVFLLLVVTFSEAENYQGTSTNDVIEASAGDDLLNLGEGNDVGYGLEGKDIIFGDSGSDVLDAGDGNDLLVGSSAASLGDTQGNDFKGGGEVDAGQAASWFRQPGGGIQYDLGTKTVQDLIKSGHLGPLQ